MAEGVAFREAGVIRLGAMESSRGPMNGDTVKTVIFGDEGRCDEERQKRTQSTNTSSGL
jgi:hypothetical protein